MGAIKLEAWATGSVALTVLDCARCGIKFGLPSSLEASLRQSGATFYCPHGHNLHFPASESQRDRELREAKERAKRAEAEVERQRSARAWAESQARGANIKAGKAKAALKRVHDRVHAGVCPHCNRTFKQLAAHMRSKHAGQR